MSPDDANVEADGEPDRWFLITSRGYWVRLKELGCWAFAEKKLGKAAAVKPGHKGIVYLTADGGRHISAIAAVIRFTGSVSKGSVGRTAFDAFFPLRVPIEVEVCPKEPVPFKPLIPVLDFIYHKRNWGSMLQGQPLKPLPDTDFEFMTQALEKAQKQEEHGL